MYKRQVHTCHHLLQLHRLDGEIGISLQRSLKFLYLYATLASVSYTHLDVYKRQGLKARSLEVRTRITIVRVPAQIGKTVLLCVSFKDTLLVGNGIAFALQLVLMG